PYMLIIGDKELERGGITTRLRTGENLPLMSVKEFVERIKEDCNKRR
ncbi:MAG: hypothetical protein DRH15_03680, partial [Deltaproteobacteria bacterium]